MINFEAFWEGLGSNRYVVMAAVVLWICHLIYLVYKSIVILSKKNQNSRNIGQGVSVIITSNNKAEYLRKNLEVFLTQDYFQYEVIVVDECSEDDTQDVLAEMQQKYPHLRTTRIFPETKFRSTKKIAINIGVLAAKYDILLFSEITCAPDSPSWVRTMQSYFDGQVAAVVGYTNYEERKEALSCRRFFRFRRFLQMILLTKSGIHVIGDGCNMGYRKSWYLEKRGYTRNSQYYLGYDTEMLRELSDKGQVKVIKDPGARMTIRDERHKAFKEDYSYYYAVQRTWPLPAKLYTDLDFFIRTLFYLSAVYLLLAGIWQKYVILFILLTFLIDFAATNVYLKHLGQKKLFITSFVENLIGFLYDWYYSIYSLFTSKKWR